jgi:signal transduction histidine kinase
VPHLIVYFGFLCSVSHEMRAPIESITMIVERLIYQKTKDLLTEKVRGEMALLRAVQHSSKMMSFLMSDLLDN